MKPVEWCTLCLGVFAVCSVIIMLFTLKAAGEESLARRMPSGSYDEERMSLIIKRSALLQDYIHKLEREVVKIKSRPSKLRGKPMG
jgi:hypothetical protein